MSVGPIEDHDAHAEKRARRLALIGLVSLCTLGLWIRLTGIGFLLPHAWEPDSLVFVRQVEHIQQNSADAEHDVWNGYYPHLIPVLASAVPFEPRVIEGRDLAQHLAAAAASRIHIRKLIAFLSVLIVPLTYVFARRFLPRAPALFGAGLMTTSLLHVWFSQETRPHAVSAAFALLALVAALRVRARGDVWAYAFAAVATLLAVCSLQSGVALLLPLLVAHVLRVRGRVRGAHFLFAACLAVTAVGVRIFYPFMFEPGAVHEPGGFEAAVGALDISGHVIDLHALRGKGFPVVLATLRSYEPISCGLALLAVAALVWGACARRPKREPGALSWRERLNGREDLVVVLAYVVPYTLVIGLYEHSFQRFVIPLLPYLATFAAFGLFALVERLVDMRADRVEPRIETRATYHARTAALLLAAALFLLQAWVAIKLAVIRTHPDTIQRAAQWISANVPSGSGHGVIAHAPTFDLPLWRTSSSLAAFTSEIATTLPWVVHQRELGAPPGDVGAYDLERIPLQTHEHRLALEADSERYVRDLHATYLVLDTFPGPFQRYYDPIRRTARKLGHLEARFSPLAVDFGDEFPLAYQDDYFDERPSWFWRVLIARSMGPVIEIYRLDPDSRR